MNRRGGWLAVRLGLALAVVGCGREEAGEPGPVGQEDAAPPFCEPGPVHPEEPPVVSQEPPVVHPEPPKVPQEPPEVPREPPEFLLVPSSPRPARAHQRHPLEVVARVARDEALSFSWSANVGQLHVGWSKHEGHSTAEWVAPACLLPHFLPTVTLTVTTTRGLSTSRSFVFSGLETCAESTTVPPPEFGGVLYTATPLPSGLVLVTGGANNYRPEPEGATASAYLYDPSSGAWTSTRPMLTRRRIHQAMLLPSGKVLVAGGDNYLDNELASAELYDPETGTWSPTGSMAVSRIWFTLTRLPSGKVLAVGSDIDDAVPELYDPETGTWSPTRPMNMPRMLHKAKLLPSGRVLVTGGYRRSADGGDAADELYDPDTDTWTLVEYGFDALSEGRRSAPGGP